MKAISLWQPWASLIACGAKKVETRHWPTAYRGPIAIHAAKRWTQAEREAADEFRFYVRPLVLPKELPLGALVATARLVSCELMTQGMIDDEQDLERECGGWEPGRFAWRLADVVPLAKPIPWRGAQGLFEVPAGVVGA